MKNTATAQLNQGSLHVTEGIGGTWHYHLSVAGTDGTALCGARTMHTSIPLSVWGFRGHLNERYCAKCAKEGSAQLRAAGVAVDTSTV